MDAGLLYEVPEKGGDQQSQGYQDEERPASYTGVMPQVQHQSISYR